MKSPIALITTTVFASAVVVIFAQQAHEPEPTRQTKVSEVAWGALNPARGDQGPRAGNLWNDRTGEKASGFLVRFVDGFSSPPHIHNVTYRGVVIGGLVHNDDPDAAEMWMPPGSFWTQPAGEVHITSAQGDDVIAYIEIDSGPYLVLPQEEAFDEGERPINMDPTNVVWLSAAHTTWIDFATESGDQLSPEIAFLWGEPGADSTSGSFLRLPAGFEGELRTETGFARVVVIEGALDLPHEDGGETVKLNPGSYLGVSPGESRSLRSGAKSRTLLYLRSEGSYQLKAATN